MYKYNPWNNSSLEKEKKTGIVVPSVFNSVNIKKHLMIAFPTAFMICELLLLLFFCFTSSSNSPTYCSSREQRMSLH